MKIEFDSTVDDAATLARVAAALLPEADSEKAPAKPRAAKAAVTENPTSAPSAAKTESPAAPANVTAPPAQSPAASAASPSSDEITAAANVAVQKVGAGGPGKVKAWIAATFTKEDGTPGTLMTTRESQRADLLAKLQQIGQGTLVL